MSELSLWIGVGTCGLGGAVAAQFCPPPATRWPDTISSLLRRRIDQIRRAPLSKPRQWAGAAAVGFILSTGCAIAYAAAPSAAEDLPGEVIGVTGSGDKLTLELRHEGGPISLKPGDVYKDGWTLQALTPTQATLSKAGVQQTVGLNPSGVVAPQPGEAAAPSQVTVNGASGAVTLVAPKAMPDAATIDKYYQARLAPYGGTIDGLFAVGQIPRLEIQALSAEELKRSLAYEGMINEERLRRNNGSPVNGPDDARRAALTPQDVRTLLGEGGFADMTAIDDKLSAAMNAQFAARAAPPLPSLEALKSGSVSVSAPLGTNSDQR